MHRKWSVLFVVVALLFSLTVPAGAQDDDTARQPGPSDEDTRTAVSPTKDKIKVTGPSPADLGVAPDSVWLLPPEFEVRPGLNQVFVTEANDGDATKLYRWVRRNGKWRAMPVETKPADDAGSAIFRDVDAGHHLMASGNRVWWSIEVGSTSRSTPTQSFYDDQELVEGFQYIDTRDGTTLSAYVVLPGPIEDGPYPTVVEYSGYDPSNPIDGLGGLAGGLDPTPFCGSLPILCKAPAQPSSLIAGILGYAVVGVNIRGTGCSGGAYDFFETMQVLDGYDVIEAVSAQPWVLNNRVGMVGLSYPGISQLFVAKSQPPSLAAIAPVSVYGDTATGVLSPGGVLNVGFATSWADNVLRNSQPSGTRWVRDVIADGDTTCAANQQLRLQNVDATAKARANPYYTDEVAVPLDIRTWAGDIDVPIFLASAFQDEQTGPSFGDLLGNFDASPSVRQIVYNGLHADGFSPQVLREWDAFLDLYVAEEVPSLPDEFDFLAPIFTQGVYGAAVPLPPDRWTDVATHAEALERWESEPEIQVLFESGAGGDDGLPIAAWSHGTDIWPPTGTSAWRQYLGADGTLGDTAGDQPGAGVAFHPNPAVASTSFHSGGGIWNADPGFVWTPQGPGENARFQTAALTEDIVLAGTASVDLWLKSDATDAELEAVISEIRPDGSEVRVQAGQLQASYRTVSDVSTELQPIQYGREGDVSPLVPGEWTEVRIQIPAFAHAFRTGSSIRLEINTPGGDTATWEFELDGPGAEATHVIGTGTDHPSSIALPVVDGLEVPTPLPGCGALRGQPCRPAPAIDQTIVSADCPTGDCVVEPPATIGGDRPAGVALPADYDPDTSYPLVVVLHGFGANGEIQASYLGISGQVDERDFILVKPDGTMNDAGTRFWSTGASCCGLGSGIDDVAYVAGLIEEAKAVYNVDDSRVYLWGHSNGGFMAYTMACEHSDKVTAIVSLAGSSFLSADDCAPHTDPVSVLQIHGDADGTIDYEGTEFYPGALEMFDRHATFLDCDLNAVQEGAALDLVNPADGPDTAVQYVDQDCAAGTSVELWTLLGGGHVPFFVPEQAPLVLDWLYAQTKPLD